MKKLVLVRHAKAIEPLAEITDSERSLKTKGIKDAHKTAQKLLVFNIKPEIIISSVAFRALETAVIFAEELDFPKKKIKLTESLYFDYTTGDFVDMIQKQDDKHNTILVVGHNPKISEMVSHFTHDFHEELPTCGLTVIEFNEKKWKNIKLREGKLSLFIFPDKEPTPEQESTKVESKSKNKPKKKGVSVSKNKKENAELPLHQKKKTNNSKVKAKAIPAKKAKSKNPNQP